MCLRLSIRISIEIRSQKKKNGLQNSLCGMSPSKSVCAKQSLRKIQQDISDYCYVVVLLIILICLILVHFLFYFCMYILSL